MTKSEWFRIGSRIQRIWPQQVISDETLVEWFGLVSDLDAGQVNAAITVLASEGREFAPHGGIIRQRVVKLRSQGVTFEQAWAAINRAMSKYGRPRELQARSYLAVLGDGMVWALVEAMGGWEQVCNGGFDEYKPTAPGVWRSQAEHAWNSIETQRREDASLAEMVSDLPRIKAARERQSQLVSAKDILPSPPPRPSAS